MYVKEKNDMDIVTFVEEYLGIELLPYQKEYLKWLSSQDTREIHNCVESYNTPIRDKMVNYEDKIEV